MNVLMAKPLSRATPNWADIHSWEEKLPNLLWAVAVFHARNCLLDAFVILLSAEKKDPIASLMN